MSDTCYVSVQVYLPQIAQFKKIVEDVISPEYGSWEELLEQEPEEEDHAGTVESLDTNYGGYGVLQAAAAAGIIFSGFSMAGAEYGPGVWCGIGGRYYEAPCTHENNPCVELDSKGRIQLASLEAAQSYYDADLRVADVLRHGNDSKVLKELAAAAFIRMFKALATSFEKDPLPKIKKPATPGEEADRMENIGQT